MENKLLAKMKSCKSVEEVKTLMSSRRALKDDELNKVAGGKPYLIAEDISCYYWLVDQIITDEGMASAVEFVQTAFKGELPADEMKEALESGGASGFINYLENNSISFNPYE